MLNVFLKHTFLDFPAAGEEVGSTLSGVKKEMPGPLGQLSGWRA
jgi:hypothetical protein